MVKPYLLYIHTYIHTFLQYITSQASGSTFSLIRRNVIYFRFVLPDMGTNILIDVLKIVDKSNVFICIVHSSLLHFKIGVQKQLFAIFRV